MKAIIIQDEDARALLDKLKLEKFEAEPSGYLADQVSSELYKCVVDDVYGKFHYIVCRWLQDQGAQITR